jgi:hypothetical protein
MPPKTEAETLVPPNLVTTETLAAPVAKPPEPAQPVVAGVVLQKGAAPAPPKPGTPAEELVTVRITKAGHGQVHNGTDGVDNTSPTYDWNDLVALPRSVAEALEGRHYAEVQN